MDYSVRRKRNGQRVVTLIQSPGEALSKALADAGLPANTLSTAPAAPASKPVTPPATTPVGLAAKFEAVGLTEGTTKARVKAKFFGRERAAFSKVKSAAEGMRGRFEEAGLFEVERYFESRVLGELRFGRCNDVEKNWAKAICLAPGHLRFIAEGIQRGLAAVIPANCEGH